MNAFAPKTLDSFEAHVPRHPYGIDATIGVPFPIHDPFGLRRAIVPVFRRDPDGMAAGMGTAFHIDGWGSALTADHVIEYTRDEHLRDVAPGVKIELDLNVSSHAAVLLGYGLIFGTRNIPDACWAPVQQIDFIVEADDDPMAALRRGPRYHVKLDVASMVTQLKKGAPAFRSLSVDFQSRPKVGDLVLAVGYPELDFRAMHGTEIKRYLEEGMFGVYGTITNLFPDGRDRNRRTPVFEVEADWPGGMSGGPVFDQRGNVIGIVSYSMQASDEVPGRGYATWLSALPRGTQLCPTLDKDNPGCRVGFGVYKSEPWHLADVRSTRQEAEYVCSTLGGGYVIGQGVHRLGTEEFMLRDAS